jgi:predicted DNA-binding protein (MmcQ/YjbR family)
LPSIERYTPFRPTAENATRYPSAARGKIAVVTEVPEDIVERIRAPCLALPEVTVRIDYPRTPARSTAHSFDIRKRSFCLLVAVADPAGASVPLLVLRASPEERRALLSQGHPFFPARADRDRIGVLLTAETDWEEIRELVTDSYRLPGATPRSN